MSAWEAKASRFKATYGLSPADYTAMYKDQHGLCAVVSCGRKADVVDHNHATGAVRGLLCAQCNSAAGLLQDSPDVVESLADYLRDKGHYG